MPRLPLLPACLPLLLALLALPAGAVDTLTLGIFTYRSKAVMAPRYEPLAEYLGSQLGDTRVEIRFLDQREMEEAIDHNTLDLVLTNPSHYQILRAHSSLTGALATLISLEDGRPTMALGGVIITRADRSDLTDLASLRGRRIAIPGAKYLGGFQAQAYELLQVVSTPPGIPGCRPSATTTRWWRRCWPARPRQVSSAPACWKP